MRQDSDGAEAEPGGQAAEDSLGKTTYTLKTVTVPTIVILTGIHAENPPGDDQKQGRHCAWQNSLGDH